MQTYREPDVKEELGSKLMPITAPVARRKPYSAYFA